MSPELSKVILIVGIVGLLFGFQKNNDNKKKSSGATLDDAKKFYKENGIWTDPAEDIRKGNLEFDRQIEILDMRGDVKRMLRLYPNLHKVFDIESLEMVGEQKKQLDELNDKFKEIALKLVGKELVGSRLNFVAMRQHKEWRNVEKTVRRQVDALELKYNSELAETFVPRQLEKMVNMHLFKGIPRVLLTSPVGDNLQLSKKQKDRIRRKSEALSAQMEKDYKDYQNQARAILEVLTKDQRTSLTDLYGKKQIETRFNMGLNQIYNDHNLPQKTKQVKK